MGKAYWTNRLCRPEDTDALMALVRAVHGDQYPELDRAYWEWRYQGNTACNTDVFMAEHDGRPIGVLPMTVFDFQWGRSRLNGVMITGLLTHPDHRRKGIFRSLIESVIQRTVQLAAPFVMGMPNEAALPGYLRFGGWEYPGLIRLYSKVVDTRAALRHRVGHTLAGLLGCLPQSLLRRRREPLSHVPAEYERTAEIPDDLDEIFEQYARDCNRLMIRRTARYWAWRYSAKPRATYQTLLSREAGQVTGAVATSMQQRAGIPVGMVMDLVTREGVKGLRQLLRAAEDDSRAREIGLITCQATSPMLQRALKEEGYWSPTPEWLPKKFHYVYRPTGVLGLPRPPMQIADWHLTFADSDNV